MDSDRDDPYDDDVTIVGDHELVVELRRLAAERSPAQGQPLPPPAWPVSTGPAEPRPTSPAASRRPAPPAPSPRVAYEDEWWYDDDDDENRARLVWLGLAIVVAAVVVVALILVR